MTVQDNRKDFDKIIEQVSLLNNSYVLTGFQEGEKTKYETKAGRTKKAGLSIPEIAAKNEFGTREIPARPFMRPSFDENRAKIQSVVDREYNRITGGESTAKKSLGILGLMMEDLIQKKIQSITFPPNSARTIAEKKSSKPLIDFGQMYSAVLSKVVLKK